MVLKMVQSKGSSKAKRKVCPMVNLKEYQRDDRLAWMMVDEMVRSMARHSGW